MTSLLLQALGSILKVPSFRSTRYECKYCHKLHRYARLRDMCQKTHALDAIREEEKKSKGKALPRMQLMRCGPYYICPLDWQLFERQKEAAQHFHECLIEHDLKTMEDILQTFEISVPQTRAKTTEDNNSEATKDVTPVAVNTAVISASAATTPAPLVPRLPSGVRMEGLQFCCEECGKAYWLREEAATCALSHRMA